MITIVWDAYTNEFVCERCGQWKEADRKWQTVCDECFENKQKDIDMKVEEELHNEGVAREDEV